MDSLRKYRFALTFSALALSLASLAQKGDLHLDTAAVVSIDVPTYRDGRHKGETTYLYKYARRDALELGLDKLEKGYDSLQMRIWLGHSLAIIRNVVVLKYFQNHWYGELWTFTYGHKAQTGEKFIARKSVKSLSPKSGWEIFIKNILDLHITTLPDDESLNGYNGCGMDGLPYYFEVATAKTYRFYRYCNIEDNIANFEEAKNVGKIAEILENEFSFRFTR